MRETVGATEHDFELTVVVDALDLGNGVNVWNFGKSIDLAVCGAQLHGHFSRSSPVYEGSQDLRATGVENRIPPQPQLPS